ncbi:hypothetical protein ACVWZR_008785 [Bradyrhizobium sp. i1.3.1]
MSMIIGARQVAGAGAGGQQLAERAAVLVVERPGVGDVIGHAENVAADQLCVVLHVGARDRQRILDHLLGRAGEQPVEAALDGDVGDDGDQHRRQHRHDREQADDLDMEARRRPAPPPRQDQLPELADDDANQQQDRGRIDQIEGADHLRRRLDPRETGQDQEGQEGRQQRHRHSKGCQPASHRPTPGLFRWGRVEVCGRGICAGHSGNGAENGVRGGRILMYSYHIVAELRQFRGALAATDRRIHRPLFWQTSLAGTDSRPCGLTAMDRFFLAMMVSAVLLLIVAADLLVNGLGVQQPLANVASAQPVSARLIR